MLFKNHVPVRNTGLLICALLCPIVILCGGETAARTEHENPHWSYQGDTGPARWGQLSDNWSVCSEGQKQSPIDIDDTITEDLSSIKADFKPARLRIIHTTHIADSINNGHTIQVNCTHGDVLTVGDQQFQLLQHHFHTPSEHTLAGKHYPMEMHMVHKSSQGKLAVVGVFIESGKHNTAFDPIWSNLPKVKGTENHFEKMTVDVDRLLPEARTTYRYEGSLTTPPCSEGVDWILMTEPIQFSENQIRAFQEIIPYNSRPVQPLNGRTITTDVLSETSAD